MPKKKPQGRNNRQPAKKKPTKQEEGVIAVRLDREFPAAQVGVLANHFVIQHDGPEFHLLFFQTHPPVILGDTEDERRKAVQEIKSVRSVCVARIIVSADRLPSFLRAMQENLEKHGHQHEGVAPEAEQTKKGVKEEQ